MFFVCCLPGCYNFTKGITFAGDIWLRRKQPKRRERTRERKAPSIFGRARRSDEVRPDPFAVLSGFYFIPTLQIAGNKVDAARSADRDRCSLQKGTIRQLIGDRGFGFIKTGREDALFFGRNQLQGVDYRSLREGQVEFEVTRDPNGHLHAIRVRLAQPEGG